MTNISSVSDLPTHEITEKPSRLKLLYEMGMLILIIIDLLIMGFDALLMSSFMTSLSNWLGFGELLHGYQSAWHHPLKTMGGFFTIFLIIELLARWAVAIQQKRYYRWFFFPFIHWYEVLGCAPQLRALRLLRAVVIGYRLYQLGYYVLPKNWIKTGVFYYEMLLEEISDRVILVAIDNIRNEISRVDGQLVQSIINNHRAEIEVVIVEVLQQEVTPILLDKTHKNPMFAEPLAEQVGLAIQQSLNNTPELRRLLKMIPIAGSIIESQIMSIGKHLGENLTLSLSKNLTQPETLDTIYQQVAKGISQVDTSNPALEKLISAIIEDSLGALESQIKIQQWKHRAINPL